MVQRPKPDAISTGDFNDNLTALQIAAIEATATNLSQVLNGVLSQLKRIQVGDGAGDWKDDPAGRSLAELAAGSSLPAPTGVDGRALIEVGGVAAYRGIRSSWIVAAFDITGFSVGVGTQEVGATVTNPNFTASYNRTPSLVRVEDNQGGPVLDVTATPNAFTYTGVYTKTGNNQSVTWNMTASETESDTASASVSWRPRAFYGVGVDGLSTEADIEALASSFLASSRAATFSVNAGAGQHIYYAFPDAYGAASFTVNGFSGGFVLVGTVSVTNAFGVTQNYFLYKSVNPGLGSTTVVAS